MAVKYDPILGKLRSRDIIPELTADPATPKAQDAWVLFNAGQTTGSPMGLLLTLTYSAGAGSGYQFSYRTIEGTTIRATLT